MAERASTAPGFRTTQWSLVLDAVAPERDARAALETLCSTYWYPLYGFVRRHGWSHEDAQDLVQAFFARLIEKRDWRVAPERGRFRSFLMAAMRNFMANARDHDRADKRGGGAPLISIDDEASGRFAAEPIEHATPQSLFERAFALRLLDEALGRLEAEQASAGNSRRFAALRPYLGADAAVPAYAALAAELSMNEGALRVALHRLRQRHGELVRRAVADIVQDPADVESEIDALLAALSP